jgi:hypothetical protein
MNAIKYANQITYPYCIQSRGKWYKPINFSDQGSLDMDKVKIRFLAYMKNFHDNHMISNGIGLYLQSRNLVVELHRK